MLPILDAEFEGSGSGGAQPSDRHDVDEAIDIPWDALEDQLEDMVEVAAQRDVSVDHDSRQADDPSGPSPAENAWLMRTIAKLRVDLSHFCKARSAETDTAVTPPRAPTINTDPCDTPPHDRPASPRVVIPPTTVDRRPDVTYDRRQSGIRPHECTKLPNPLASWARRQVDDSKARHPFEAIGDEDGGFDEFRQLMQALRVPPNYPRGCRIQRVRARSRGRKQHDRGERGPVIVLSKRTLKAARTSSVSS